MLEFTSYHGLAGRKVLHGFLPHPLVDVEQRLIRLDPQESELKHRMYECFAPREVLSAFSTAIERFRPAPRYVFTRAPHAARLNYERYGDPERGAKWRSEAEEALHALGVR